MPRMRVRANCIALGRIYISVVGLDTGVAPYCMQPIVVVNAGMPPD